MRSSIVGEFVPSLSSEANEMGSSCSVPVSLLPESMRTSPPFAFEYLVRVWVWVKVRVRFGFGMGDGGGEFGDGSGERRLPPGSRCGAKI